MTSMIRLSKYGIHTYTPSIHILNKYMHTYSFWYSTICYWCCYLHLTQAPPLLCSPYRSDWIPILDQRTLPQPTGGEGKEEEEEGEGRSFIHLISSLKHTHTHTHTLTGEIPSILLADSFFFRSLNLQRFFYTSKQHNTTWSNNTQLCPGVQYGHFTHIHILYAKIRPTEPYWNIPSVLKWNQSYHDMSP